MTWPYDARWKSKSANQQVESELLNEVQDKIVDLFSDHDLIEVHAHPSKTGGVANWEIIIGNPENGWERTGAGSIIFHLRARVGLVIKQIKIKYYNATGTTHTITWDLYEIDPKFSDSSTAPTIGSSLKTISDSVAGTSWVVLDSGAMSQSVAAGKRLVLKDNTTSINADKVAGIQLTVQPLTAS